MSPMLTGVSDDGRVAVVVECLKRLVGRECNGRRTRTR